jgi:hypothetical protein
MVKLLEMKIAGPKSPRRSLQLGFPGGIRSEVEGECPEGKP